MCYLLFISSVDEYIISIIRDNTFEFDTCDTSFWYSFHISNFLLLIYYLDLLTLISLWCAVLRPVTNITYEMWFYICEPASSRQNKLTSVIARHDLQCFVYSVKDHCTLESSSSTLGWMQQQTGRLEYKSVLSEESVLLGFVVRLQKDTPQGSQHTLTWMVVLSIFHVCTVWMDGWMDGWIS